MTDKTLLAISIADITPIRIAIDALAEIAGMNMGDDGYSARNMQEVALDAIKQIADVDQSP
tara:strand:- start:339 stop:521 length:183 start_codon:yes stop_codon:yes gene_type:complete